MADKHAMPKSRWIQKGKFVTTLTIIAGFIALLYYYSWWLSEGRLSSLLPLLAFLCALIYGTFQLVGNWILYLAANRRPRRDRIPVPDNLSVDVYVTAYNEEIELIEECLVAACNMVVDHQTYLLDDGDRPELAALAKRLGVHYLTRPGNLDFKAGNVNAALPRSDGDIIVIFDVDHIPDARFLERTLGYFAEAEVGFVQAMLTFGNTSGNWVARSAAYTSLDFYNPISMGTDGLGSTTLVGSNALIRRAALESIGGYQSGLAEDLATSIALHAAGWKSIYINKPLAPGIAPPDLNAWFNQQFKWARGVFEVFLTTDWGTIKRLTAGQKLSYGVRMTYYWIGLVFFVHLLATAAVLFSRREEMLAYYEGYLLYALPLIVITPLIRSVILRYHAHISIKKKMQKAVYLQWQPMFLVLGTWPVYVLAWLMAVMRVPLTYRPTAKEVSRRRLDFSWIWPQLVSITALLFCMITAGLSIDLRSYWLIIVFAISLVLIQLWVIIYAFYEPLVTRENSASVHKVRVNHPHSKI